MKKYSILILSLIFLLSNSSVSAFTMTFAVEQISFDDIYPLPNAGCMREYYITAINSTPYLVSTFTPHLIPYDESEYQFFIEQMKTPNYYIRAGENYFVRNAGLDPANAIKVWSESRYPVQLYDKNFNLLKEHTFDMYVTDISYYDGKYYCYLPTKVIPNSTECIPPRVMVSTDFENWEQTTDNMLPRANNKLAYKCPNAGTINISQPTDSVALKFGAFIPIQYEAERKSSYCTEFGDWIVKYDAEGSFYFSNDNVYFVKIAVPTAIKIWLVDNIYENSGCITVILQDNMPRSWKLTVSTQELYDALEAQKSAPYVCVNDTILGFTQPPITESDRTLVPMRFLFEQLGAEVDWDNDTQTAIAQKANTTINFSIDNTTATVNGEQVTMDVPARLVGDKTMVPLRFLSEELGYTVEWDEETRMATVIMPGQLHD